jgi:hypothetical protein
LNGHGFFLSTDAVNYFLVFKSRLPKSPVGGRSKSLGGATSRSWMGGKAKSAVLVTGAGAGPETLEGAEEADAGGGKSAEGA